MEDTSSSPPALKAKEQTESILFTYFQGDINSVVDEHFSRALNKAHKPKDLSIKTKSPQSRTLKPGGPVPMQQGYPTSSWPDPNFPSTSAGHIQFTPLENPHTPPQHVMGPAGQPSNLWPLPPRGLGPVMYPPQALCAEAPVPAERHYPNSFLNMLHSDRSVGGGAPGPASKPDSAPGWSGPAGFRDSLGSGMSLDSGTDSYAIRDPVMQKSIFGLQVPEKKDLYWY